MKTSIPMYFGIAALGLAALACAFFSPNPDPVVPGRLGVFPHAVHVGDEVSLDCVDCHDAAETEAFAGMPNLNLCSSCHDEDDESSKDLAQRLSSFVVAGSEQATWSSVTQPSVELVFSHASHLAADVDCETCHQGVRDSIQTSWNWKLSMDSCLECHQSQGLDSLDCEDCHRGVGTSERPASHNNGWQQRHGMFASIEDLHNPLPARDCALCHTQEGCNSCHRTTQPVSHTEAWRVKGHGFAADLERDSCATCHTEASCSRCHRTTRPSSHGGIWGNTTSAHCLSCHLPLGAGDRCSACHQATPSHNQAPLRLGPPHPGSASDCRSCHMPLNHLDNGQDCILCHR